MIALKGKNGWRVAVIGSPHPFLNYTFLDTPRTINRLFADILSEFWYFWKRLTTDFQEILTVDLSWQNWISSWNFSFSSISKILKMFVSWHVHIGEWQLDKFLKGWVFLFDFKNVKCGGGGEFVWPLMHLRSFLVVCWSANVLRHPLMKLTG